MNNLPENSSGYNNTNHIDKRDIYIDIAYLSILPLLSLIGISLHIKCVAIFSKPIFKDNKIYKFLMINSITESALLTLTILAFMTQCKHICFYSNYSVIQKIEVIFRIYLIRTVKVIDVQHIVIYH
jgi:hypothetical protein